MRSISTLTFQHTLKDIHKNTDNRKFCFVLGAGASRKSGIPTGGELSKRWFSEIKERIDTTEFSSWLKDQKINENDLAASYGSIYRKRFENDKTSGYEFLVQEMKTAKPSFGHIILAQILSRTSGHCVLTTNFDSLVESSVYQFTNKTPLVCGHESLSGYARPSKTHPLIVKIHRDLLLAPKSDPDEISELDPGWKEPLDLIFSTHIPIVIGYGGNDGSLMSYFEKMNKPSNFFWCGLNESNLSERIKKLIEKHDGRFVTVDGFDELMHKLLLVFDEIKPIKDELQEITHERIVIANKQLDEINSPEIIEDVSSTINTSTEKQLSEELSALEYSNLAEKEPDFKNRKEIYLRALEKYPTTGWLWWQFTYFQHFVNRDFENLNQYYLNALRFNPHMHGIMLNYALYLQNVVKDYNQTESYLLKALALENSAFGNRLYAIFLDTIKNDIEKAEDYYLKSLAIDADDAATNAAYALFLKNRRSDLDKAEEHFKKSIVNDPNNAINNCNYANFLFTNRNEAEKAESFFRAAILNDPNNSKINCQYALYLKKAKNDLDSAAKHYLASLSTEPDYAIANGNIAQILLEQGRILEANQFIETAFQNCLVENELLIELWFYRYAHYPDFLLEAEIKIEDLLSKGLRSLDWDFEGNYNQALKDNHPNKEKLRNFIERINAK